MAVSAAANCFPDWISPDENDIYSMSFNLYGFPESIVEDWIGKKDRKSGWVALDGRVFSVEVVSTEFVEAEAYNHDFIVKFKSSLLETANPHGAFGLFSFDSFPPQTWKISEDKSVVETNQGKFKIKFEQMNEESEFIEFKFTIQKLIESGKWDIIGQFIDQDQNWVVDIDGDGVPEVVGATGYKDRILRRVWPNMETLVLNKSGV